MPKKSWRDRLMNYKYYYTHGLFDLMRRREKNVLEKIVPECISPIPEELLSPCDSLILISAAYPMTKDTDLMLVDIDGSNQIASFVQVDLFRLFVAAQEACGEKILFTSTYRTLDFQASIYGINPFAAKPGESEHHSGLCADIKVDGYAQRRFILSKTGKWMAKHAHRYGFIIRYPLWAEKRTGMDYEPWHLRYVGIPHAEAIYRMKITLEEYLACLEVGEFYRLGEYAISRQTEDTLVFPTNCVDAVMVSKDTRGGKILWGKIC